MRMLWHLQFVELAIYILREIRRIHSKISQLSLFNQKVDSVDLPGSGPLSCIYLSIWVQLFAKEIKKPWWKFSTFLSSYYPLSVPAIMLCLALSLSSMEERACQVSIFIFALANVKIIKTYICMCCSASYYKVDVLLTSHHNAIWVGIYYKTTNRDVWGVLWWTDSQAGTYSYL